MTRRRLDRCRLVALLALAACGHDAANHDAAVTADASTAPGAGAAGDAGPPPTTYALPPDRSTTWKPGVTNNGGIPARTTACATINATGTTADRTDAINAAIASCPDGQAVVLGAGDFRISGTIEGKSNITLRGAGLDASAQQRTRLWKDYSLAYTAGAIIHAGGLGGEAGSTPLTAATTPGATSVTVASVTGLAAGQLVLVSQVTDDTLWRWGGWSVRDVVFTPSSVGRGWFTRQDRPTGQLVIIDHVSGNTVAFTTPLRLAYAPTFAAEVTSFASAPVVGFGVEDLLVEGDPTYNGTPGNITAGGVVQLDGALKSWIQRAEVRYTLDGGVRFNYALMCEARHVYVHNASNPTPGGAGYLVQFDGYTSDSLLEDSVLLYSDKLVVGRGPGPGNVIGYNYADDGFDDTNHAWSDFGLIATHLVGGHFFLFEGNEAPNGDGDDIWGNANWIVFFRNHLCGQRGCGRASAIPGETGPRRMASADWANKYYSAIGNVLGLPGVDYTGFVYEQTTAPWTSPAVYALGWSPEFADPDGHPALNSVGTNSGWDIDGDPAVISTYLRVGNFDYVTGEQRTHAVGSATFTAGVPLPLPASLYLSARPAFFGARAWPWVEPGGPTRLLTLPARARYDAGTPNALN
jgi:hypothetical protein